MAWRGNGGILIYIQLSILDSLYVVTVIMHRIDISYNWPDARSRELMPQ